MIPEQLNIDIEQDMENQLIMLNLKAGKRCISLGLNVQEAQMLGLMLTECVSDMLIKNLQLYPHQSENTH